MLLCRIRLLKIRSSCSRGGSSKDQWPIWLKTPTTPPATLWPITPKTNKQKMLAQTLRPSQPKATRRM